MVKKLFIIISILAVSIPALALEKAATVNSSKGRVEIVHGDAVMGKRAKTGAELVLKDILRTKRRGYAEVGFIDGTSVKVFEKSRLTINGIERTTDGYNAEIQKGKVLFNVEKMANVAGDFRVKTTNSVIGVKGTTFGVVSGGMVTIVEVYNGNVEVLATASVGDLEAGKVDVGALEGAGKGGDADANKQTLATNLSSGQGLILSSSGDVQVYEFSADGGGKSLIFQGDVAAGKKGDDKGAGDGGDDDGNADDGDADDDGGDDDETGTAEGAAEDGGDAGETGGAEGAADDGGDAGDPDAPDGDAPKGGAGAVDDALFGAIGLIEEAAAGDGGLGLGGDGAGDGAGGAGRDGADLPGGGGFDALGDVMDGVDVGDVIADALTPDGPDGQGAGDGGGLPDIGDIADDIADVVDAANDFYSDPDARPDTEEQIEQVLGTVNINITFK